MEDSFLTDIKNDKNILLLLKQKEDGSKVICNDCKIFLKCNICDEDLTLKIQKLKQVLYCHQCNKSFNLINKCPNCQSWNLDMLGLNKNNVTSFVKENYKFTQNIKIDTISNIDLYKKNKFDHIYLLTVDGYMFNSSFDSEEFLYRLLFDLKDMTDFLSVQTSFPAPNVLVTFKNKNYESIFNKEIEKREKLNSPPFGVYYKVEALNKRGSKILEKIVIYLDKLNISYILKNSFSLEIYIKKENKVKVEKMLNFYFSSDISVIKKV